MILRNQSENFRAYTGKALKITVGRYIDIGTEFILL